MRSPPARRTRSSCYRLAGHCLFSLRVTLSHERGWSNGFEWDSNFVWCLMLLSWMMSCTAGIPRSLWIIWFVTYRLWPFWRNIFAITIVVIFVPSVIHHSFTYKKTLIILLFARITSFHVYVLWSLWHMHGSMWRVPRFALHFSTLCITSNHAYVITTIRHIHGTT
jgi:hypothetical protein